MIISTREKAQEPEFFSRESLLAQSRMLLSKERFSKEDGARCDQWTKMAALFPTEGQISARSAQRGAEDRALNGYLKSRADARALGLATAQQTTATSDLVQQAFMRKATPVLKAYDPFFDSEVVGSFEAETGAPIIMPQLSDVDNGATEVSESAQDAEEEPTLMTGVALPTAKTFRTGIVLMSRELVNDSGIDISDLLVPPFAIRLSRGAGASLGSTLVGAAKLGATANGSSANTGGSETGATSIGYADLIALRTSVNKAYRKSPKCSWFMTDDTLSALDSILDRNGRPVIAPEHDSQGRRILLGYPVNISPSLDDIGASKKPVLFGDASYFAVRYVANQTNIQRLNELFAEYDQIAFRAQMRLSALLLGVTATDSPVKYLANAAS